MTIAPDETPATFQLRRPFFGCDLQLRIVVALDDRECKEVVVREAPYRREVGRFDVRYADPHQPFYALLELPPDVAPGAVVELQLELTAGTGPLVVFGPAAPDFCRPEIVVVARERSVEPFFRRMTSLASIQPFGWMEGCVLDGQLELARTRSRFAADSATAAAAHLDMYIGEDHVEYESPRGRPLCDTFYGIEATLPVAAAARLAPHSLAVDLALAAWEEWLDPDGCVKDVPTTCEGMYTIAYPMAVVASQRDDTRLAHVAVDQILIRRDRLRLGRHLFLRRYPDGDLVYRDWSRAYAWYLLGTIRTALALSGLIATEELSAVFLDAVDDVLDHFDTAASLWHAFIDDPLTLPETCGSAGIATALALGVEAGHLGERSHAVARETWRELTRRLSPDGVVTGSSQANKGGEVLQRQGYRVASGVASGLTLQLGAALERLG